MQVCGLIRPVPGVCATTDTTQGEKRLSSGQVQAILTTDGRLLGKCRSRIAETNIALYCETNMDFENSMRITLAVFFCLTSTEASSDTNVFSQSPVERALADAQQAMQDRRHQIYYRGAILDYDLLATHTRVPRNVLQSAVLLSDKEGVERNEYIINFAETVGQYISEGRDIRSSVHAVLSDNPKAADDLLELAIRLVKANSDSTTIRLFADIGGHFWGMVTADTAKLKMLIDTGATSILLRSADAEALGIDLRYIVYDTPFETAGGVQSFGQVSIPKLSVFGYEFFDVPAFVCPPHVSCTVSLLGMSILREFSKVTLSGNVLVIEP